MRVWTVAVVLAACRDDRVARSARPAEPVAAIDAGAACDPTSRPLAPGLVREQWSLAPGDGCVDVVRADLARVHPRALVTADGGDGRTAPAWADAEHLLAVINIGMFADDRTPVGLVIVDGVAHGRDQAKMGGFVAWDPIDPHAPAIVATGRDCAGFDRAALAARYRVVVQGYRLLGCDGGAIAWQDPKRYSAAAIAVDRAGRLVLLHARAPRLMAELSRALAAHDLAGALFVEGGPEASLYVRGPGGTVEDIGSYETGFLESDDNRTFWRLPNVIGLEAR